MGTAPKTTLDLETVIRLLREWLPGISVEQLPVTYPADDDGIWYFSLPGRDGEVHIESSTGTGPFEVVSTDQDDSITATNPSDVARTVARLLTALPAGERRGSPIRVYADFNSRTDAGACWCLRYGDRPLDEVADALSLAHGMPVVLYYADETEEFEYDGTLVRENSDDRTRWFALAHEESFRRIR